MCSGARRARWSPVWGRGACPRHSCARSPWHFASAPVRNVRIQRFRWVDGVHRNATSTAMENERQRGLLVDVKTKSTRRCFNNSRWCNLTQVVRLVPSFTGEKPKCDFVLYYFLKTCVRVIFHFFSHPTNCPHCGGIDTRAHGEFRHDVSLLYSGDGQQMPPV